MSLFARIRDLLFQSPPPEANPYGDDDALIPLDAEDLAEQGIAAAYAALQPRLEKYVQHATAVEDVADDEVMSYAVRANGETHVIYGPSIPGSDEQSWARATYFFFRLVNDQLESTPVRFYAVNDGNDLMGIFLTPAQSLDMRAKLPRKQDWPYIPELREPAYGRYG